MAGIIIRRLQRTDEDAIEKITYRTGFKGEGLDGRDYFNDRRLFYLIFMAYYARFEPDHFFVAVDTEDDEKVVGYICGTTDTARKDERFNQHMIWRVLLRAITFTSWRHPKTLLTTWRLARMLSQAPAISSPGDNILEAYPAHLHINILPEYQSAGIGSRLIKHFEEHLLSLGIQGVHLGTSSRNIKALPFYKKHDYQIIQDLPIDNHPVFDNINILTFAKKLAKFSPDH